MKDFDVEMDQNKLIVGKGEKCSPPDKRASNNGLTKISIVKQNFKLHITNQHKHAHKRIHKKTKWNLLIKIKQDLREYSAKCIEQTKKWKKTEN